MDTTDLLAIGESLHYPFLILDQVEEDYLRSGELAWRALLKSGNSELIGKLEERLSKWQERVKREQGE